MKDQFIGAVATELGINRRTLRYYEGLGLLPPPRRTNSGYRVYDGRTGFRIQFIRKGKSLGLTLKEIQAILEVYNGGKPPCRPFRRLLKTHVHRIDTQIQHLRSLRDDLRRLLTGWPDRCETNRNGVCPRLEDFADPIRKTTRVPKGG